MPDIFIKGPAAAMTLGGDAIFIQKYTLSINGEEVNVTGADGTNAGFTDEEIGNLSFELTIDTLILATEANLAKFKLRSEAALVLKAKPGGGDLVNCAKALCTKPKVDQDATSGMARVQCVFKNRGAFTSALLVAPA